MKRFLDYYKKMFKENGRWFRAVTIWFLMAMIFGVTAFRLNPRLLEEIMKDYYEKFGSDIIFDAKLVLLIFKNNLTVVTASLISGLLLGLGPILIIIVNGFVVGYVVAAFFTTPNTSVIELVTRSLVYLLPHGIIEIPAILIGAALGLRLGTNWIRSETKWKTFKQDLLLVLLYLPGIAFLLLIAAFIEVYVGKFLL